ncbi:MAG: sugar-binding protein [Verrucomicrobia bacterium]|nr:sugar-binding protein [Verrucomicrobiota bacterium]
MKISVWLIVWLVAFASACLNAQGPAWWSQRGVLNGDATPDDYAAVNQGQVRNIAKQGYEEMKAKLPDGAGATLDALWATPAGSTDDYRAINLGQLKNLAKPFYDRLAIFGYTGQPLAAGQTYPWSNSATAADDYALVNIGQVKNLFSFDLSAFSASFDSDGNGLPDWWELKYFGHIGNNAAANPSGDGMSNLYKYSMSLNPLVNEGSNDKDADGISNQEDARPNNNTIGRLTVTIAAPLDGSVFP